MSEICDRCGHESLMFANIGAMFGVPPFCLNCDDVPPGVVIVDGGGEE